jgi:hypothetical protein
MLRDAAAMTEFWKLPVGVHVEATDEALPDLEALAAYVAPSGWGIELGAQVHFRFAKLIEAHSFVLACHYPCAGADTI